MGATAAISIAALGTGLGAFGQYSAGQAQKAVGQVNAKNIEDIGELNAKLVEQGTEDNAAIAEYNARMSEAKAVDAVRRGQVTETNLRTDVKGFIGSQRASYAAQGVDVSSGSSLEVQTGTAFQAEKDALTIRTNAALEAWGFKVDAQDSRLQAAAIRKSGKLQAQSVRDTSRAEALSSRLGGSNAAQSGTFGAAATIVGGAGNITYQRYGFGKSA